jgi:CBS domain-containing membrane protein
MLPRSFDTWLSALRPAPLHTDARERLRAAIGAGIGLLFMGWLCHLLGARLGLSPWALAPLGASAVLVFALPASPMAQPWSVVVGNTVSVSVGVAVANWVPIDPVLAGPVAVCLAIVLMMATRSLHPPGGAMALTAVLSHAQSWSYPLFPAFTNSLLLVLAGVAFNNATGRRYPHAQGAAAAAVGSHQPSQPDALSEVLRRYNQVLDVSRDDLEALLHETERLAYRQRLDNLRCENIMSRQLITVQFGTPLQDAWNLLRQHQIKALPVVDQYEHLMGIITLADFMRHAEVDTPKALSQRLRQFLKPTPGMTSDKVEVAGQIMTRQVRVASAQRPLMDLVPLFTRDGHHHIPIVGEHRKLVGIITQSDFLRAWSQAVQEGWQLA